ncbi:terminase [Nonomuraea basaltis]|uniref:terminase n=1 Tax=Nonomuraea basaltis TaxID=2495887 RepID=UPI00110C6E04|nr:terminase [Nonomuraea basaltis]TMR95589.1 terminase [Nonomuraea basaltis]
MSEAPGDLGEAGKALWERVTADFELSTAELVTLLEVCRTVDELDGMRAVLMVDPATVTGSTGQPRANPLFQEARAHRLLLQKLLGDLALPLEGEEVGRTPKQQQASEAAKARWDLERAKWGHGGKAS